MLISWRVVEFFVGRTAWTLLLLGMAFSLAGAAAAQEGHCKCDKSSARQWFDRVGEAVRSPVGWAGAGAASAGLAWVTWTRAWVPRALLAVPGYARLSRDEVTEHPTRASTLDLVRRNPACTTKDLAAICELNGGTLRYHLSVLERSGLIRSARLGRDRVWCEPATASLDAGGLTALRAPIRKTLLSVISSQPGLTQGQLARALKRSKATTHYHLGELKGAGLVTATREGLRVRYHAGPSAAVSPREAAQPVDAGSARPVRFFRR